jgi:hypothetical protein
MSFGILEPPAASKKLVDNDFYQRREAEDDYTGCVASDVWVFGFQADFGRAFAGAIEQRCGFIAVAAVG